VIFIEMALPKTKEIVSSNPVVVFSKTYCPFCVNVKQLLTQLGATFKAIELDTETDGSDVQSALKEWTGQKTVPNVFIGGNHIGGCDSRILTP
jgi:glutaredoxin 3